MKNMASLLPSLAKYIFFNEIDNAESTLIAMLRLLNKSEKKEDQRISAQLSKIIKEYRAGFFSDNDVLRSVNNSQDTIKHDDFFQIVHPNASFNSLILNDDIKTRVENILESYRNEKKLFDNGVLPIRRVLISGKPGTGKSSIAAVIARELNLELLIIRTPIIFSSLMGDSSKNLITLFEKIQDRSAVILFDEFDSIAVSRNSPNEVGEMRRVVNTILTILDHWHGKGILIATTNESRHLDEAVWRRFDETLEMNLPDVSQRIDLWNKYSDQILKRDELRIIANISDEKSPADIENIMQQAKRNLILKNIPLFETIVSILGKNAKTIQQKKEISKRLKDIDQNLSMREIGSMLSVSKSTIQRYLQE
ncbi:AAA family ATPase [Lactiplantibacillus plantarum]|uniref:AAA family ATPase n=1 Tax=Lactiplantibacillus plantarum TaxID=1590 RepID=UPI002FDB6941